MELSMSERFSEIVKQSGMTKTAFAASVNISQSYLSELCSGKAKNPSDRTIADICRVFKINEVWLRTGEGKMYSDTPEKDAIYTVLASAMGPMNSEQDRFIRAISQIPREYLAPISQVALAISKAMYPDLFQHSAEAQPSAPEEPHCSEDDTSTKPPEKPPDT